jgi:predicted nucleic acid-binding protein
MLVIADSSPLIVLTNIGRTQILTTLFGAVTIPLQVADELDSANRQHFNPPSQSPIP